MFWRLLTSSSAVSFPDFFPIRLLWLEAVLGVLGGGSMVAVALLFVIVSDVTPSSQTYVNPPKGLKAFTDHFVLQGQYLLPPRRSEFPLLPCCTASGCKADGDLTMDPILPRSRSPSLCNPHHYRSARNPRLPEASRPHPTYTKALFQSR